MRTELVAAPTIEPVTLADAKAFCRIENVDDDALVTSLIARARDYAERFTQRSLLQQTLKLSLDQEDCATRNRFIRLRRPEILSIDSFTSYASDNTPTVFDPASYRISGDRLVLNDGYSFPVGTRCFDAYEIVYKAGYGATADKVPPLMVEAISLLIAHWYENREAAGDPIVKGAEDPNETTIPFGVTQILQGFRIFQI